MLILYKKQWYKRFFQKVKEAFSNNALSNQENYAIFFLILKLYTMHILSFNRNNYAEEKKKSYS